MLTCLNSNKLASMLGFWWTSLKIVWLLNKKIPKTIIEAWVKSVHWCLCFRLESLYCAIDVIFGEINLKIRLKNMSKNNEKPLINLYKGFSWKKKLKKEEKIPHVSLEFIINKKTSIMLIRYNFFQYIQSCTIEKTL